MEKGEEGKREKQQKNCMRAMRLFLEIDATDLSEFFHSYFSVHTQFLFLFLPSMLHLSIVYRQFKYISTREREAKRNKFGILSQSFWGVRAHLLEIDRSLVQLYASMN